jgi:enoyl-[acyl-carrier-protein] reductase (NADH)
MINLAGKTAVVFGLANKRSIAWGIALQLHKAGATLAICYQNERMKLEAEGLIAELSGASGFQCDVSADADSDALFSSTSWSTPSPSPPPPSSAVTSSRPAAKASAPPWTSASTP